MSTNDGGPAFPTDATTFHQGMSGMTLRDYFAGQALAGMLASPDRPYSPKHAYEFADDMLAARDGEKEQK